MLYLFDIYKCRLGSFYTVAPCEVIQTPITSSCKVKKKKEKAILAKMEYHKVCSSLFPIKNGNSSKPSGLLQRLKQSLHKSVRQNKQALCACRPPGKGVSQS